MAYVVPAIAGAGAGRFGVKRTSELIWVPTIADADLVPTEAEIEAGTNLTCGIESVSGFTAQDTYAELPDMCSDYNGKVWDGATLADSSIVFWLDSTAAGDAYALFTGGEDGNLLHCPWGLEDSKPAIVWAVTVGAVLPPIIQSGAAVVNVGFATRAVEKVTLPVST